MRVLAIETVEFTGSVAALEDDEVLVAQPLESERRSAQTLAPAMHDVLRRAGWRPADVQLVAVASGPGSFTGLRIGVTTAKTFAYAAGCEVIGVHTLLAIAAQAPNEVARLTTILDAQRGELFVADFVRQPDGNLMGEDRTRVVAASEWLASLSPQTVVTGPALTKLRAKLPGHAQVLDEALWQPSATSVGRVGRRLFAAGARSTAIELLPSYFRRTAAEEQWERRHGG